MQNIVVLEMKIFQGNGLDKRIIVPRDLNLFILWF